MQDCKRDDGNEDAAGDVGGDLTEQMLREVLSGETYDAVAERYGTTRTNVERRTKALVGRALAAVGIDGLNEEGIGFVRRLRAHRESVLAAVEALQDLRPSGPVAREIRILSEEEVNTGARRIRARSQQPLEDLVLYYLLFVTGARPLEIARLEVSDYLDADGSVRRRSEMRAEVAITGRTRPMYFRSVRLDEALDEYLAYRLTNKLGLGCATDYRGMAPHSPLLLSPSGCGYEISRYGSEGQRRFRCRGIQEAYRKLWRYAEFKQLTSLGVRHTVAARLYDRGADEMQVGLLLGIVERSAVREMFPRRLPSLSQLTDNLV